MVELQNIYFAYGKKRPLFQNLSLSLTNGHIYGLFGKNGAGKTTLLKIMSGLRFAQTGKASIFGERAELRKPCVLQDIYFLAEEMYVPTLKIKNLAKIYAPFYPNFNLQQFNGYLQQFDFTSQEDFLHKLSHGQKKKVLIAFALASNTKVLIMDEPTNGLDIPSKSIFRQVMASVANENRMIIISTHQVRDLHSLIDSILILYESEIVLNQSTEAITKKLSFRYIDGETESKDILYSEDSIRGTIAVSENHNHEESKLDMELLFNAVLSNKQRIQEIFLSDNTLN